MAKKRKKSPQRTAKGYRKASGVLDTIIREMDMSGAASKEIKELAKKLDSRKRAKSTVEKVYGMSKRVKSKDIVNALIEKLGKRGLLNKRNAPALLSKALEVALAYEEEGVSATKWLDAIKRSTLHAIKSAENMELYAGMELAKAKVFNK